MATTKPSEKPPARPVVKHEGPEAEIVRRRFGDWFELPDFGRFFEGFGGLRPWPFEEAIRVEQEVVGDSMVIRAELPGIDPDKELEILVGEGTLTLKATRTREEKEEHDEFFRSEFRYGSFTRTLPLPKGVTADAVVARYDDGVLEITVPMPAPMTEPKRIPITK